MDADIKKLETGELLKRQKPRKYPKKAELPADARAVFRKFVVYAMGGKSSFLIRKKALPAVVELACSFMQWAVHVNSMFLSDVCEYIPWLCDAVLNDWQEVIVGIPVPVHLKELKKGCARLREHKGGHIKALKSESEFRKAWEALAETPDSPVPALPQDVDRLIEACGPTPHGQRMAAFLCAVFESRFSVTPW
jgi:hypothetical protein